MTVSNYCRNAFSIYGVAALLAGCGGGQSPVGVLSTTPQGTARASHIDRRASRMLAEAKSDSELLYVTDAQSNQVSVVKLPQGKLVGTLDGFNGPSGECTDSGGDVFITDTEAAQIWEYAHGAKSPKNILEDPTYYPIGCSVDHKTGNLAVTNEIGDSGPGNLAVYAKAAGKPKYYSDPTITQFGFCAYDGAGNLYTGGGISGDNNLFAELPKGQNKFVNVTLNADVSGLSPMRWDGEDLAILDGEPGSLIYRFKMSGHTGTAVGLLRLKGATEIGDFTIQDGMLYAPVYNKSEVNRYAYPGGGKSLQTFFGFGVPSSTAVSTIGKD
jgi:hypothetical protein